MIHSPHTARAPASLMGPCNRFRFGTNAARFRAALVQFRPAERRADARRLIPRPLVPALFAPRGRNRAARKKRGTVMTKERFDIPQHITEKVVSAIERGAGEFRLPWHRGSGNIMRPVNIASKNTYRGANVVALWASAEASGYSSGTWGTYR
jgi:hypothetical protein